MTRPKSYCRFKNLARLTWSFTVGCQCSGDWQIWLSCLWLSRGRRRNHHLSKGRRRNQHPSRGRMRDRHLQGTTLRRNLTECCKVSSVFGMHIMGVVEKCPVLSIWYDTLESVRECFWNQLAKEKQDSTFQISNQRRGCLEPTPLQIRWPAVCCTLVHCRPTLNDIFTEAFTGARITLTHLMYDQCDLCNFLPPVYH